MALTASALGAHSQGLREIGATLGTLVSFAFLWLIALINLLTLRSIWAAFRRVRATGTYEHADLDSMLVKGGVAALPNTFAPRRN